jgi:ribosomal protein S18 acetylase RimI-like enzyme
MDNIRFDGIDVYDLQELESLAKVYCEIWQEPPWNETHWTISGVVEDIQKYLGCPYSFGIKAMCADNVAGFTWGCRISFPELFELSGRRDLESLFVDGARVFYVAELGVNKAFRGQSLGRELSQRLISLATFSGMNRFVLRTDELADPAKGLYRSLGFRESEVRDATHPTRIYWVR